MGRRNTILVLVGLALILLFLAGRESYQLFHEVRHLNAPTHETREPFGRNVHRWMNVEDVARFYKVTTADVFTALDIEPVPGDEKLSLKDLVNKYHKSASEIEAACNKLKNADPNPGEKP